MTAARKRTTKTKKPARNTKLNAGVTSDTVWKIFRFTERFELPDDVKRSRKSPLLYCRDYVGGGSDDESISYIKQLTELRSKPGWHTALAAFYLLRNVAANQGRGLRGYLVDGRFRPASLETMSLWLDLDNKVTAQVLATLEEVGLLERVTAPDFEKLVSGDDDSASDGERSRAAASGRGRRGAAAGDGAQPLKKKSKRKRKSKRKSKSKALSASDKAENTKEKENKNKADKARPGSRQGQGGAEASASPPTTQEKPTKKPKEADQSGSCDSARTQTRLADLSSEQKLRRVSTIYAPDCRQFGAEIFASLKVPYDPGSVEGRRELGCFAAAWSEAQAVKLPPTAMDELWHKSVRSAQRIAAKRKRVRFTKSPEAVWRNEFNQRLKSAMNNCVNRCKAM